MSFYIHSFYVSFVLLIMFLLLSQKIQIKTGLLLQFFFVNKDKLNFKNDYTTYHVA